MAAAPGQSDSHDHVSNLRKFAQGVRHLPGIGRLDFLWRALRPAYHLALNIGGRGVEVRVGGYARVRMPTEFVGGSWERHEPEAIAAYARWIGQHPCALVLDIGSSVGIFSAIALFADSCVEVVAFDSDLPSLAAARRMCRYAPGNRLGLVHGFLGEHPTEACSMATARARTEAALAQGEVLGEGRPPRYVGLNDGDIAGIPIRRLDDLLAGAYARGRAVLLKCDVEGAELLVLRGAEALLRHSAPVLLISVHPPVLHSYGYSIGELRSFLTGSGYKIRVLAVDHEEHWWCEPTNAVSTSSGG